MSGFIFTQSTYSTLSTNQPYIPVTRNAFNSQPVSHNSQMELQSSNIPAHLVEGPIILSIDIGTSAVKILFFDTMGRAVESNQYRREVTIRTSRDGASEVAPDELLDTVWQGIDAVLEEGGRLVPKIASCRLHLCRQHHGH